MPNNRAAAGVYSNTIGVLDRKRKKSIQSLISQERKVKDDIRAFEKEKFQIIRATGPDKTKQSGDKHTRPSSLTKPFRPFKLNAKGKSAKSEDTSFCLNKDVGIEALGDFRDIDDESDADGCDDSEELPLLKRARDFAQDFVDDDTDEDITLEGRCHPNKESVIGASSSSVTTSDDSQLDVSDTSNSRNSAQSLISVVRSVGESLRGTESGFSNRSDDHNPGSFPITTRHRDVRSRGKGSVNIQHEMTNAVQRIIAAKDRMVLRRIKKESYLSQLKKLTLSSKTSRGDNGEFVSIVGVPATKVKSGRLKSKSESLSAKKKPSVSTSARNAAVPKETSNSSCSQWHQLCQRIRSEYSDITSRDNDEDAKLCSSGGCDPQVHQEGAVGGRMSDSSQPHNLVKRGGNPNAKHQAGQLESFSKHTSPPVILQTDESSILTATPTKNNSFPGDPARLTYTDSHSTTPANFGVSSLNTCSTVDTKSTDASHSVVPTPNPSHWSHVEETMLRLYHRAYVSGRGTETTKVLNYFRDGWVSATTHTRALAQFLQKSDLYPFSEEDQAYLYRLASRWKVICHRPPGEVTIIITVALYDRPQFLQKSDLYPFPEEDQAYLYRVASRWKVVVQRSPEVTITVALHDRPQFLQKSDLYPFPEEDQAYLYRVASRWKEGYDKVVGQRSPEEVTMDDVWGIWEKDDDQLFFSNIVLRLGETGRQCGLNIDPVSLLDCRYPYLTSSCGRDVISIMCIAVGIPPHDVISPSLFDVNSGKSVTLAEPVIDTGVEIGSDEGAKRSGLGGMTGVGSVPRVSSLGLPHEYFHVKPVPSKSEDTESELDISNLCHNSADDSASFRRSIERNIMAELKRCGHSSECDASLRGVRGKSYGAEIARSVSGNATSGVIARSAGGNATSREGMAGTRSSVCTRDILSSSVRRSSIPDVMNRGPNALGVMRSSGRGPSTDHLVRSSIIRRASTSEMTTGDDSALTETTIRSD